MRVLYVNPMTYGANPGVDAIAHGLDGTLADAGIELRVLVADFRDPGWPAVTGDAVRRGIAAQVDAIVLYALVPGQLETPARESREAGIPVFAFERPPFPVTACVAYPNYNQGLYMAEHLASLLPGGGSVGVIGGPEVSDDVELVAGIVAGVERAGLSLANDPTQDRHRNHSDVEEGGREAALRLLADVSQLDGLIPYNDETMHGALAALEELGRAGEARIVSRNGSPRGVEAVRDGRSDGTWDVCCPEIGAAMGGLVVRALRRGEELGGEVVLSPVGRMITRETLARWRPWTERARYRELGIGL